MSTLAGLNAPAFNCVLTVKAQQPFPRPGIEDGATCARLSARVLKADSPAASIERVKSVASRRVSISASSSKAAPPALATGRGAVEGTGKGSILRAPIRYGVPPPDGEEGYICFTPREEGKPYSNLGVRAVEVDVEDMRGSEVPFDIDIHGFQLVPFCSAGHDLYDNEVVESVLYAEVEQLVRDFTGAQHVKVFSHTRRHNQEDLKAHLKREKILPSPERQALDMTHVDFSEMSGPRRIKMFAGDQFGDLSHYRHAIIQVWMPLKSPVMEAPLALCDARSVQPSDIITSTMYMQNIVSEAQFLIFNPSHMWYYVPQMTTNEAFLFKGYDSDANRAQYTPHAAFYDPTTPEDAEPRQSIELRSYAIWEP